jgi:type IV pilus assembly protein PilB
VTERLSAATLPFADGWLAQPLVDAGVLTPEQVRQLQGEGAGELWGAAVARGWATSARIVGVIASRFKVPVADLARGEPRVTALIPETVARRHRIIPLAADDRRIVVATSDPRDLAVEQNLGFLTGRTIEFQVAPPDELGRRLDELYRPERSIERLLSGLGPANVETVVERMAPEESKDPVLEAPVAKLVDALIAEGVRERASDIHFDPDEGGMVVRYRVDGVLRQVMRLPESAGAAVVRRVKILANLDVTNPLVPADGRATARVDAKTVDLRVATAPVARRGQKAVIRILDPGNLKTRLADLGLVPSEHEAILRLLGFREGIVLVTGPTGSGKTTTLYAALNQLKTGKVNIITVEDPVEYELGGVSQIQVNEGQGLTFASVLRSVLRQDPDIVLVGEIRDVETATTAVQAGLTGHLVLSTLHTNDAPSAVVRLRDMGLDAFKIAAVLKGVVAQRLVRRLCDHCAVSADATSLRADAAPPRGSGRSVTLRRAVGCRECNGTGYRGRTPVVEILPVTPPVAKVIGNGEPPASLESAARAAGMRTLWQSGLERVWDGITTVEELERVLGEQQPEAAVEAPAAPPAPRAASLVAEPGATPGDAPARVLVADDDEQMRRLLRMVLEREGYIISEAVDGLDTLDQAEQKPFDLVILDMDMPRLDGCGVLEELRTRVPTAAIPVIMLTAKAEGEAQALDLGAQDFLAKPIQPSSLKARVRAVLRRSKL